MFFTFGVAQSNTTVRHRAARARIQLAQIPAVTSSSARRPPAPGPRLISKCWAEKYSGVVRLSMLPGLHHGHKDVQV